jgi:serine/threonine-protein kinase
MLPTATDLRAPAAAPPPGPPPEDAAGRYAPLQRIGAGGSAEVWAVHDRWLDREVVLKAAHLGLSPAARAAFLAEARRTARLQHPTILAVYDAGQLIDGRPYLTMGRAVGRPLGRGPGVGGLRRAIEALRQAAAAVGAAHAVGVIHRDLKPENILVGDQGEVQLIDWGLALDRAEALAGPPPAGTPGFCPPEQAAGAPLGPTADVWALGACLHVLLCGAPPGAAVLDPSAPPALAAVCAWALRPEPAERPAEGGAFAAALASWLDADAGRDRALALAARAEAVEASAEAARSRASAAEAAASAALAGVPAWADAGQKTAGWAALDEAAAAQIEAAARDAEAEGLLLAALTEDPGCPPATRALARRAAVGWEAAVARRDYSAAARFEDQLRRFGGPERALWSAGEGLLHVETAPPGLPVRLAPLGGVRLRAPGALGPPTWGPAVLRLPTGGYLAVVEGPAGPVELPVQVIRGGEADLCGGSGGALRLPPVAAPGERVLAAGWSWLGGDPLAAASLPRGRWWVPAFALCTHPVTNAEYIDYLNVLVSRGARAEAEARAPRSGGRPGEGAVYAQDADGRFFLAPDAQGDLWAPDWPVVLIDAQDAAAYAAWRADRDALPWRLPSEVEWERAARGVDERPFPWGEALDPSLCCMRESHPGRPLLASIHDFPLDRSPWGVAGLGGNVRDWCLEAPEPEGPPRDPDGQLLLRPGPPRGPRVARGGSWISNAQHVRSAHRHQLDAEGRKETTGLRLARSLG